MNTSITRPETIFNPSQFYISTPMIERLSEQIHMWLWNGSTGGVVLGMYRIGKTRAVSYLQNFLVNRVNEPIPAHYFSIARRDQNTVASVYRNLCLSLNMLPKTRTTADEMANDLIHYFGEAALSNSTKQVVLIVDEFQRLHLRQLEAFAEIHDRLSEIGVNLCVIFVGNSSSARPLIENVLLPSNELLRGRFFTKLYTYRGIQNHDELRSILKSFDLENTDTGLSITKYFIKENYPEEWKLSFLSHDIWDVFNNEYKARFNIDSWGMQYFIAMIKVLLIDYLPNYGITDTGSTREMIKHSIDASGLVPDLVSAN